VNIDSRSEGLHPIVNSFMGEVVSLFYAADWTFPACQLLLIHVVFRVFEDEQPIKIFTVLTLMRFLSSVSSLMVYCQVGRL
jgi:hypothetical protein